ncbi:unnamed protein product [Amoebophrya sp. A25]|nr:unnamed protein product [Amoebophrya sp. A25]|eukprot:GSA25T00008621001.1
MSGVQDRAKLFESGAFNKGPATVRAGSIGGNVGENVDYYEHLKKNEEIEIEHGPMWKRPGGFLRRLFFGDYADTRSSTNSRGSYIARDSFADTAFMFAILLFTLAGVAFLMGPEAVSGYIDKIPVEMPAMPELPTAPAAPMITMPSMPSISMPSFGLPVHGDAPQHGRALGYATDFLYFPVPYVAKMMAM